MRVIEVPEYGGPEVLRLAERPVPAPVPGKVRVRMSATAVNPADLAIRQGVFALRMPNLPFPFVLGWEIAGTVLEDSAGFTAGQRVFGAIPWLLEGTGEGAEAEVVVADPTWLAPLPADVDWTFAGTLGLNGLTAHQGLDLLGLTPGDTVFITGASGAVGGFAVQLAARQGMNVVALASAGDEDYVAGLGAKQVVTRGEPLPTGLGAMFDPALIGDLSPLRDGGVYVGTSDPALPEAVRGIEVTVVHTVPNPAQLNEVATLHTRVAEVLPIEQAADAHRQVRAGGFRGKIVLAF
jgi:NADPH:quinone reductase-like Zn-dependent oxidoreductase